MPLSIERPQHEVMLAGKVAQLSEISSVTLTDTKARLHLERLRKPGIHEKIPSIEMRISTKSRGTLISANTLQATLNLRLLGTSKGKGGQPVLEIACSYVVEYRLAEGYKPTPAEVRAFVSANALFNCWPFWREFVQSTAARMSLPPVTLPFFRIRSRKATQRGTVRKAANKDEKKDQ